MNSPFNCLDFNCLDYFSQVDIVGNYSFMASTLTPDVVADEAT